jgi:hypothetical protein
MRADLRIPRTRQNPRRNNRYPVEENNDDESDAGDNAGDAGDVDEKLKESKSEK